MAREIVLTPDFKALFAMFDREARLKCDTILADLHPPVRDCVEAWQEAQVSILRAIQGILAPLNICAQSASTVEDFARLREILHECVQLIQSKADGIENALDEQLGISEEEC
jgi:hypothetical protein